MLCSFSFILIQTKLGEITRFVRDDCGLGPPTLARQKDKGLPLVTFHALRHTHASVLIRESVDILTISRRLGHSKASITLDVYGHMIGGADEAAAKAIEKVMK
jgi:integrase